MWERMFDLVLGLKKEHRLMMVITLIYAVTLFGITVDVEAMENWLQLVGYTIRTLCIACIIQLSVFFLTNIFWKELNRGLNKTFVVISGNVLSLAFLPLGHIGLQRFFAALKNRRELNRPVRVAFLGDSFIEGDIMVADFRSGMQKEFGGRGVGFVPVTSVAAQFRPTVEQRASGWTTWSMLTDHEHGYTLSGMMFEANEENASIHVKTTKRYPELQTFSSLKLIYEQNKNTEMRLVCNASADTLQEMLPATSIVTQYELEGMFTEADFTFKNTPEFRALGVAMEDHLGVVVDNFSLRGNSGMILERLDVSRCQALNKIRPYDLIVLQYGLNVVSDNVMNYGWYSSRMVKVINHIQLCFPEADILMLGVSDRSRQDDGEFETMPAVLALLHAQRQAAKKAGVPFWNVFGAMGGENSMVRFVELNWASKDYTHLSFRGGREIADALLKALLSEKDFYDEAEKVVN